MEFPGIGEKLREGKKWQELLEKLKTEDFWNI